MPYLAMPIFRNPLLKILDPPLHCNRAAQEAGVPHREYINRKKENAIFTPL